MSGSYAKAKHEGQTKRLSAFVHTKARSDWDTRSKVDRSWFFKRSTVTALLTQRAMSLTTKTTSDSFSRFFAKTSRARLLSPQPTSTQTGSATGSATPKQIGSTPEHQPVKFDTPEALHLEKGW